jgi:hypothetical protein
VRVAGEADRLGGDAARLELVQLLEEDARVDDEPGAEHALLAPEDPRGHVLELVGLAVGDDGMARIGAALVAAHEIGVLGEQIDDLALALVSPLRADDDCRRHDESVCQKNKSVKDARLRPIRTAESRTRWPQTSCRDSLLVTCRFEPGRQKPWKRNALRIPSGPAKSRKAGRTRRSAGPARRFSSRG